MPLLAIYFRYSSPTKKDRTSQEVRSFSLKVNHALSYHPADLGGTSRNLIL